MDQIAKMHYKSFNIYLLLILALMILSINDSQAQVDFEKPFLDCGLKGSITIYDYNERKWIGNNIEDSNVGTLPASTFKIINTMIALETGVISNIDQVIKWPGNTDTIKYGYRPEIYHDISVRDAFRESAGWAYIEIAKKIGKPVYEKFLKASKYGNLNLSVEDDDFWNFGKFQISPVNQILTLIGIYEESLPFKKSSFAIVKELMIVQQTKEYTLRAKTGWTRQGGQEIGWWVGYVERGKHPYFFATRLIKNRSDINKNFGPSRKEITLTILKALQLI